MFGQAYHFNNYAKQDVPYAKARYNNESVRLYRVLDNRLAESEWLGGDEYTIADMATYPWTRGHKDRGIDQAGFRHFMRWFHAMEGRPAVQRTNQMAEQIRERMNKSTEGKTAIDFTNTEDNAKRLSRATGH